MLITISQKDTSSAFAITIPEGIPYKELLKNLIKTSSIAIKSMKSILNSLADSNADLINFLGNKDFYPELVTIPTEKGTADDLFRYKCPRVFENMTRLFAGIYSKEPVQSTTTIGEIFNYVFGEDFIGDTVRLKIAFTPYEMEIIGDLTIFEKLRLKFAGVGYGYDEDGNFFLSYKTASHTMKFNFIMYHHLFNSKAFTEIIIAYLNERRAYKAKA